MEIYQIYRFTVNFVYRKFWKFTKFTVLRAFPGNNGIYRFTVLPFYGAPWPKTCLRPAPYTQTPQEDVGHAGEVDDVDDDDDDDDDEDDHADEDEDGEDDDNNDGDSDSDNDVDDCTTDDDDDDDDGVDDVTKVMLKLILAGIVVENPFAKCFREKTIWFPNVENLECSLFTRN